MYLYETHCHTSVGSHCGKATPEEQVDFYAANGYTGLFITDHFPISKKFEDSDAPWEVQLGKILESYRRAKVRGDEVGLDVFFAWEFGHGGCDLLTYGLDESFLLAHPDLRKTEVEDYCNMVHEAGGFLVHAHPFREAKYIHEIKLVPWCEDAVETFNANRSPECNEMALLYARHYAKPCTCGSDNHTASGQKTLAGMISREKLTSPADYIALVKSGDYKFWHKDLIIPEF